MKSIKSIKSVRFIKSPHLLFLARTRCGLTNLTGLTRLMCWVDGLDLSVVGWLCSFRGKLLDKFSSMQWTFSLPSDHLAFQ